LNRKINKIVQKSLFFVLILQHTHVIQLVINNTFGPLV